jgi:Xaa-Pro aminopeptidase
MTVAPFLARRRRLLESMGTGVAIIPTSPERIRNRDALYPYRADSYFHYLSGFPEPEAVLVLVAGDSPRSILFCRERDPEREVWDGFRYGPDGARENFGVDAAFALSGLEEKLVELLVDQPALWFSFGQDSLWDARIASVLNAVRAQSRAGKRAPAQIIDVRTVLDEMRLIKDADEIELLRRSANIAAGAHQRAMRTAAPGRYEYELEAELLHEFRRHGCQYPAYTPIVASGANACVLHYVDNARQMADGELVLIDAGGELDGYAADITRTFPVSGRFTPPQAELVGLVLAAQEAAIAAICPGASFIAPHEAALHVLVQGFIDLGLLSGSLDEALAGETYKRFYMHRTSHWLGLDVHDAGEYRKGETWRSLVPGMVLTIEPGCYVRAAEDIPAPYRDMGVRIEDDVLVTAAGCEVLTAAAPKTIAEIESVMSNRLD